MRKVFQLNKVHAFYFGGEARDFSICSDFILMALGHDPLEVTIEITDYWQSGALKVEPRIIGWSLFGDAPLQRNISFDVKGDRWVSLLSHRQSILPDLSPFYIRIREIGSPIL